MIRYNYVHSSIRTTIERAFGLLKGRFRRLKYLDKENVETMTKHDHDQTLLQLLVVYITFILCMRI